MIDSQTTRGLARRTRSEISAAAHDVRVAAARVARREERFRLVLEKNRAEHADALAALKAAQDRLAAASAATHVAGDDAVAAILKGRAR